MSTHIVYHHPCADGCTAALAAWLKFGDAATYHPTNYSGPKPEIPDGAHVYFVDFSWPRADLLALASRVEKLVILDHHQTAAAALQGFPDAIFDMNKSGCRLAWEYFHPGKRMPDMFALVEDRDLWRFNLPHTKAFGAYLRMQPCTIPAYCAAMRDMETYSGEERILAAGNAPVYPSEVCALLLNRPLQEGFNRRHDAIEARDEAIAVLRELVNASAMKAAHFPEEWHKADLLVRAANP